MFWGPHLLEWRAPLAFALAISALYTLLGVAIDRNARRGLAVCALLLQNLGYGYGAIVAANLYFDHQPPRVFEAKVLGKKESDGDSGTTYSITVGAWHPYSEAQSHKVPGSLFESVSAGGRVRVRMYAGALGYPRIDLAK